MAQLELDLFQLLKEHDCGWRPCGPFLESAPETGTSYWFETKSKKAHIWEEVVSELVAVSVYTVTGAEISKKIMHRSKAPVLKFGQKAKLRCESAPHLRARQLVNKYNPVIVASALLRAMPELTPKAAYLAAWYQTHITPPLNLRDLSRVNASEGTLVLSPLQIKGLQDTLKPVS